MQTFTRAIDQLHPYVWQLNLFYLGEPFLCENLPAMIRYAHAHRMNVSVSSNLTTLDERMADQLIAEKLDHLIVSLDGTTQESYTKYRIGGNYQTVLDNIILLNEKKKQKASPHPRIEIQFVIFKHNEREIPRIKELARQLGVGIYFREGTLGGRGQSPPLSKDFQLAEKWLSPNKDFRREYDYFDRKPYIQEGICGYLWRVATINWDGSVFPCCWVFESKHSFGNIMEQSFEEIWNNAFFRSSRSLFQRSKRLFLKSRPHNPETICYRCKMFRHNLNNQC
jgi:radical SAM protein with 4Fe4S-binding SPASM domain